MLERSTCERIFKQSNELLIYKNITLDPLVSSFLKIIEILGSKEFNPDELTTFCRDFFSQLAEKTELNQEEIVGNPWQNYLLEQIINSENTFTIKAANHGYEHIGKALKEAVGQDLAFLKYLAGLSQQVYETATNVLEEYKTNLNPFYSIPNWSELAPIETPSTNSLIKKARHNLKEKLLETDNWGKEGVKLLADYYHAYGAGIFGSYWAFRWEQTANGRALEGIGNPDPISFSDLIGYETERNEVINNTEKFLMGLPAVNVLLYGARGTGKSSTVKALLNAYGAQGLRIIELPKRYLSDYQQILRIIAPQPQKFIIFIDDLSFEEDELEYKELKALLEGSLQPKPKNVLVYATSNQRHLIKEYFSDRKAANNNEVRMGDTVQEKLSLAERFGLTVIFPSPDQEQYLTIVQELAKKENIKIEPDELRRQALQWALYQNGTSGRTARQFVDYLYGETQ
ncbi:MAG: uncharacterized protein PWP31_1447 [Clostridia bacterium]|nr:uncharacterized protein [Clostridia bacterium]